MTYLNLRNQGENMDYKTLKNNHEEKSEAEHKELIVTANKGLKAIETLSKKYSDLTVFEAPDGFQYKMDESGGLFGYEDTVKEK